MAKKSTKRAANGRRKKKRGRKATSSLVPGRPGRKPALASVPTEALRAELERRQAAATQLLEAREKAASYLADLETELSLLGMISARPGRKRGRPKGSRNKTTTAKPAAAGKKSGKRGGGRRPKNEMSLVEALQKVLAGTTMGVSEAADAALAAGYKTSSPNFRTIVNQTLLSKKDTFKKVERGKYTAK